MAGGHDRAVVLVVERGAAKINQADVGALDATHFAVLVLKINTLESKFQKDLKRPHLPVVERRGKLRVHKQDVLRLEVGVGELVVVQELDRVAQLVGHVPHVVHRVRFVVVFSLLLCERQRLKISSRLNKN